MQGNITSIVLLALVLAIVPAVCEESDGFVLYPPGEQMDENERVKASCRNEGERYFSVAAMFVGFREALEACVIVTIMLQLLVKTNMLQFRKYVWYGVGSGMLVALIIGVGVVAAYYAAQNAFMSTSAKAIFSGVFSLLAAIFLTLLGLEFLRFNDIQAKYRLKMADGIQKAKDEAAANRLATGEVVNEESLMADAEAAMRGNMLKHKELRGTAWSIMLLCFTAVLREGLETVVFIAAVGATAEPAAIAIGTLVGIILGILFGFIILIMGYCMKNLKIFVVVMTVLVIFISAGLMGVSAAAFKLAALRERGLYDEDTWITQHIYDIHKQTGQGHQFCGFFAVLRAIFGYVHNPSALWWFVYLGYFAIVLVVLGYRWYTGSIWSKTGKDPWLEEVEEGQVEVDNQVNASKGTDVNTRGPPSSSGSASGDLVISMPSAHRHSQPPMPPQMPTNLMQAQAQLAGYPHFYPNTTNLSRPSSAVQPQVLNVPNMYPASPPSMQGQHVGTMQGQHFGTMFVSPYAGVFQTQ